MAKDHPNLAEPLCTADLKRTSDWVFDKKNDFQRMTTWYRGFARIAGEDSGMASTLTRWVDYTQDGQITNKDFEMMHERLNGWLDRKEKRFDRHLPYAGQLAFGTTVGLTVAGTIKFALRHKIKMIVAGSLLYNANNLLTDYTTPQAIIARQQYEDSVEKAEVWLDAMKPLNSMGRADAAMFLDKVGLGCINRKLGPGGWADGPTGHASVAFGLWWGLRVL